MRHIRSEVSAGRVTGPPVLARRLGPIDAAALIVANVIGTGVLFAPAQIAANVPHAVAFLATWLAGGVLVFAGAMAYAELAAARPKAGGEYVYLTEAFGPAAGFLTGWTSFVAGFSGAIATSAVVLALYVGRFVPGAADSQPFVAFTIVPGLIDVSVSPQRLVAIAAIVGMAMLHLRGVGLGRTIGDVLAALKVGALVLFIALGFPLGEGRVANLIEPGPATTGGWLLALIAVMYAYSGWNAAAYVAEEVRDPGRNVPRGIALGAAIVVAIHVCINALYLYVLPVRELALVRGSVLDVIADGLFGSAAGHVIGVVSIVGLLASLSAMTFAGPRVYFAMARDGLFFRRAATIHPRYGTPAAAILAQAAWSIVLVLTMTADRLLTYTGFAIVLFSGIAVASVFVLRRRPRSSPIPFRAWGYPWAPALFVLASLAIVINGVVRDPSPTITGLLIIAAGVPVYLWFRRRL